MTRVSFGLRLFGLAAATVFLTACPLRQTGHSTGLNQLKQSWVVKGDPNELIRGARLQKDAPFTAENISKLNGYYLATVMIFSEKEFLKQTDQPVNLLEENAPEDRTKKKSHGEERAVRVSQAGAGYKVQAGSIITLSFEAVNGNRLQAVDVQAGPAQQKILPLHWSESSDGRYISFLFSFSDASSGRVLMAVYFEKGDSPGLVPELESRFSFLAGPGKKVNWQRKAGEPLNVDLCGSPEAFELTKQSLSQWTKHLQGRLNVQLRQAATFAPFTDLNQHCIYYVNSYLFEARPNVLVYGATNTLMSLSSVAIVDSDVLMFKGELQKIKNAKGAAESLDREFRMAVVHELGHLFGLDHKFDGTPSVMSYDLKHDEPQAYDIEALQALYPLEAQLTH